MYEALPNAKVMIIELKVAKEMDELDKKCDEALRQIQSQKYEEKYRRDGYESFIHYGIAFCRKRCKVKTDKSV
jgi:hypothetical protein